MVPDAYGRQRAVVYAFCSEVGEVVDECSDTGVAQRKLAWWQRE
jgi:15-cis-phytoene synthase